MISKKTAQRGFTLIELMIVVAIVGILAVLAVFGVRRYLAQAKSAEATNALGQMNKGAVMGYEEESTPIELLAPGASSAVTVHKLCDGATVTVPTAIAAVKGKKYLANNAPGKDYHIDAATQHTGFSCLKFDMSEPQQYRYAYSGGTAVGALSGTVAEANVATASGAVGTASWIVSAEGDLNGDGAVFSSFATGGKVQGAGGGDRANPNTEIEVDNPEE